MIISNEELVRRYQSGEQNMLDQLWAQNEKFIIKQAGKWKGYAELEDLTQEGFLILATAANDYQKDRGTLFISYLGKRLDWGWAKYLIETGTPIRLPHYLAGNVMKYRLAAARYESMYGQKPTEATMCCLMDMTRGQIRTIRHASNVGRVASLNETVGDEDSSERIDLIADDTDITESVDDQVQNEQLAAVLWPMVEGLPEKQAITIWERYKHNQTFKEISKKINVSLNGAAQVHAKGLRNLRRAKRAKELRAFLDDPYNNGIKRTGLSQFNITWTSATEWAAIGNELRKPGKMKHLQK